MWKMDIVYVLNNEIKRIERLDDIILGRWLQEKKHIIKYDYQHRAWVVTGGINEIEIAELHALI